LLSLNKSDSTPSRDRYYLNLADGSGFNFDTDVVGPFQSRNLQTAIAALLRSPFVITESEFISGLKNVKSSTRFIGRWTILQEKPLVIADSAHNEAGLKLVLERAQKMCPGRLHILMGLVKEKDPSKILSLFPKDAQYTFCQAQIPRAMPLTDLENHAAAFNLNGKGIADVQKAYESARADLKEGDCLFVLGSIYVLAEII